MSYYNKLWGALVGNVVALLIVWAASTGLAECVEVGVVETCSVFGFTTAQLTGAVMLLFNSFFVYIFPANK